MSFCARCGEPAEATDHARCDEKLQLEPPRYCAECGRRMIVQVLPQSWTARCIEHGDVSS